MGYYITTIKAKYIRTELGIDYRDSYKLWSKAGDIFAVDYFTGESCKVIGRSDDLEKLCDYFMLGNAFRQHHANQVIYWSYAEAKMYAEKTGQRVIGYICTERNGFKGIEPVAITNEKGELKLLWTKRPFCLQPPLSQGR